MGPLIRGTSLVIATVLVAGLGACSEKKKSEAPPAEVNAVTIDGVDYGYSVSGTVKAGLTKITFANKGKDFHMLELTKLQPGKTAADALDALKTEDETDDAAVFVAPDESFDGKPQPVTPDASTTTYARLETGAYALLCFFPSKDDGAPHYLKGMVNALTVTAETTAMPEPRTVGEVTTSDTKLTAPDLSSGKGTYKYTNTGTTTHALLFLKLDDGKTYDDFITWVNAYFGGQAKLDDRPAESWGGVEATEKTTFFELNLPPGRYAAIDTESPEGKEDTEGGEFFRDAQGGLRVEFTVA